MSFVGNIMAARAAKKMGKYNQAVANQEAAYARKRAAIREKVYNTIERPRFLDQQQQQYSNFMVSALRTGAEYREGTTPFLVGIRNRTNQMLDLALSDYNNKVTVNDINNQASLIEARGAGERYKGDLVAASEYAKAGASLLTMGYNTYNQGSLVIS